MNLPPPTARLCGATVALFFALFSEFAVAQPRTLSPNVEDAVLNLPDAPTPQTGIPIASGASSSSSASQEGSSAAPASGSDTIQPPPPTTPAAASGCSTTTPATTAPACSAAPSPTALPIAPTAAQARQQQHDEAERELKVQEKQRLLGVMPQFQVVMGGEAVPLTGGEKWRLALHSAVDPFYIGWAFVIGGGYGELVGNNNGYGWGADGYIKRVGANYADNVNGALIGNALLPQILHQDPRYFRKGTGPIFKRFLYAAKSTVVCHGDNGKTQANISNVLGNYISGAISNSYYPANERGVKLTLENGTSVTLFGALGGQILEFGPDIARLVHHQRSTNPLASPATAPATPATAPPTEPSPPAAAH